MMLKKLLTKIRFEYTYPFIGAIIIASLTFFFCIDLISRREFDKVLNSVITFSSIIIGFIGVLLTILISIRETEIVQYIFQNQTKQTITGYFKSAIFSGVLLVAISSILYLVRDKANYQWASVLWTFFVTLFLLCSYRVIDIVQGIIFKDPTATAKAPPGKHIPEQSATDLKAKLKKTI